MQYYNKMIVGKRIKQIRKSRNMTQSMLSETLDYTNERQLQRIENGETACSIDKLMEIAQILGTSTDFLLFGEKLKGDDLLDCVIGKSENQILYLKRLLRTAALNMELFDMR